MTCEPGDLPLKGSSTRLGSLVEHYMNPVRWARFFSKAKEPFLFLRSKKEGG